MHAESNLRRRAHSAGLRLITYPESSRWYPQYGPYALADAGTSGLVVYGLDADALAAELDG